MSGRVEFQGAATLKVLFPKMGSLVFCLESRPVSEEWSAEMEKVLRGKAWRDL